MAYKKGIPITGGFYPMDNGDFPLVEAADVYVDDNSRLSDELSEISNNLNLIKPQLDASVSTVNNKSATNHAVVINADDIKMSSSENVTIPNKLKQYVKSVNGSTPDPITGDVVIAGDEDPSVGLIKRSINIATTAWQGSGPFTYTYNDPDIAADMCVLEAYLSDEYAQLGINSYTIQNGSLIISTTVKPTDDWNLTIALGMDGSTFMDDITNLKIKVGNGTLNTEAITLIGAVNELNARTGSEINVSDTDSSSIATAVSDLESTKLDKPVGVQAGKFLQTDSNGNAIWGTEASPTAIATATTDWLDANVPKDTTVAIDKSLTISNAAADAKVTGDAINELESIVGNGSLDTEATTLIGAINEVNEKNSGYISLYKRNNHLCVKLTDMGNLTFVHENRRLVIYG